ncbi:hypothetical protein M0811_00333 [Anaeramoeba ignava]|uniref:Uncharacterized protein n=1 Tax=Anaeramoeba ignava TaxID=1746090 RepID=A0A9Q0LQA9_ANAIG|nr:hypothetical protein M0811_00333 [Anaeramoeba ignava]
MKKRLKRKKVINKNNANQQVKQLPGYYFDLKEQKYYKINDQIRLKIQKEKDKKKEKEKLVEKENRKMKTKNYKNFAVVESKSVFYSQITNNSKVFKYPEQEIFYSLYSNLELSNSKLLDYNSVNEEHVFGIETFFSFGSCGVKMESNPIKPEFIVIGNENSKLSLIDFEIKQNDLEIIPKIEFIKIENSQISLLNWIEGNEIIYSLLGNSNQGGQLRMMNIGTYNIETWLDFPMKSVWSFCYRNDFWNRFNNGSKNFNKNSIHLIGVGISKGGFAMDFQTHQLIRSIFTAKSDVLSQQISTGESVILNGCRSGRIYIQDLRQKKSSLVLNKFNRNLSPVSNMIFLSDEFRLLCSGMDGRVVMSDLRFVKDQFMLRKSENSFSFNSLKVDPQESLVFFAGKNGKIEGLPLNLNKNLKFEYENEKNDPIVSFVVNEEWRNYEDHKLISKNGILSFTKNYELNYFSKRNKILNKI